MVVHHQNVETIALALGSNLGDRLGHLRAALGELAPYFTVTAKSGIYETPPAYVADQPAYLNAAVVGTCSLPPLELLRQLKQSETALGRTVSFRYGPRSIDLDLVFYGDRCLETVELTLPHAGLAEREFVLRPLADIAGDWLHPEHGQTIAKMLSRLGTDTARRIKDEW